MKTIQQKTVIRYSISFKQMVVKELEAVGSWQLAVGSGYETINYLINGRF